MNASLFRRMVAAVLFLVAFPVTAQPMVETPPVRVFDAGELPSYRYTVVERIWTGTLRTLYWLPGHDDAGAAVAALTDKARSLGADGVVNLHCLKDGSYYCYGLAIRLK